jgi:hypothetical protein
MSVALSWPRPPFAANPREPNVPRAVQRRFAWSTRAARELWKPRLESLRVAAHAIELDLVQTAALPATVLLAPFQYLESFLAKTAVLGLVPVPIGGILERHFDEHEGDISDPLTALTYPILVGTPNTIKTTLDLMGRNHPREIAAWFKYPDCCAEAWQSAQAAGWTDPVAAALRTARESATAEPGAAHVALAALGFGPVRHAVCSVHCRCAEANAQGFIAAGRDLGFDHEMSWLDEIAEWGIDYSVVAGIAEIRTALFRCTYFSDPGEAPVRFRHQGRVSSESTPKRRGISALSPAPADAAKQSSFRTKSPSAESMRDDFGTGWAAAGFDGPFAMRSRLCTIIWEQTRLLRGKVSSVMNLSCGDGLLLELAMEVNPRLVPFGSDTHEDLVAAARERHSRHAANFFAADWLTSLIRWRAMIGKAADVLFLDPETLVDMPSQSAAAIRSELAISARSIVAIASDRALVRFSNVDALAEAAGLAVIPGSGDRVSAIVMPGKAIAAESFLPAQNEAGAAVRHP